MSRAEGKQGRPLARRYHRPQGLSYCQAAGCALQTRLYCWFCPGVYCVAHLREHIGEQHG